MSRVSVIMITSRGDHPFDGTSLHCFDPVTKTLADQTFRDFELIVVDPLYEQRSDWFLRNRQPFPVKHVAADPNHWHPVGRSGACAQVNRGFVWCDGEMAWVGCENNLYPPRFLSVAWSVFAMGLLPAAWYVRCSLSQFDEPAASPVRFDLLGYTETSVIGIDHRYETYLGKPGKEIAPIHYENFYSHSGMALETAMEINGYDEAFDGDLTLSDCDLGSRLEMAGYGSRMRLHRDLFVVKNGGGQDFKRQPMIKCNYALYLYNRKAKRVRGNAALTDADVADIRRTICGRVCSIRDRCVSDPEVWEHDLYPLYGDGSSDLVQHWLRRPVDFDLRSEVQKRKRSEAPYDRATVIP